VEAYRPRKQAGSSPSAQRPPKAPERPKEQRFATEEPIPRERGHGPSPGPSPRPRQDGRTRRLSAQAPSTPRHACSESIAGQASSEMTWPAHASTSARKRPGSIAGAFLKMATTAAVGTNRWRRRGVISPTGTPLRVMTKDSPWSSRRMISPLSLRSSRWVMNSAIFNGHGRTWVSRRINARRPRPRRSGPRHRR